MDAVTNFAYTTVAVPPSPASSGLSLVVVDGGVLPEPPFNAVVYPAGVSLPLASNAEIVRVNANASGVLGLATRDAEPGGITRAIRAGDQFMAAITAGLLRQIATTGPEGPKGATGATGAAGPEGPKGATGPESTAIAANTQSSAYTLVLSDAGKVVELNAASATAFTIPPHSAVAFPVGTVVEFAQIGAGQLELKAGAGVILDTPSSLITRVRWSTMAIRQRAENEWILSGDLA